MRYLEFQAYTNFIFIFIFLDGCKCELEMMAIPSKSQQTESIVTLMCCVQHQESKRKNILPDKNNNNEWFLFQFGILVLSFSTNI